MFAPRLLVSPDLVPRAALVGLAPARATRRPCRPSHSVRPGAALPMALRSVRSPGSWPGGCPVLPRRVRPPARSTSPLCRFSSRSRTGWHGQVPSVSVGALGENLATSISATSLKPASPASCRTRAVQSLSTSAFAVPCRSRSGPGTAIRLRTMDAEISRAGAPGQPGRPGPAAPARCRCRGSRRSAASGLSSPPTMGIGTSSSSRGRPLGRPNVNCYDSIVARLS